MPKVKFVFLILPEVHLLDLAGPAQVISEAIDLGADLEIEHAGVRESIRTSAGLGITGLKPFTNVDIRKGDFLVIPGSRVGYIRSAAFRQNTELFRWLRLAHANRVNLVSICVGAFTLAEAGLLDGLPCTTHFKLTESLQRQFPLLKVKENVLFVSEGTVHTSAGIASGIDLMLSLLEQLTDSYFAHKVARELVVYNRRTGMSGQISAYFNHRNHVHHGIHTVQDRIIEHVAKKHQLHELASIACMSERNFTRLFKKETGVTVKEYITQIRLEKIKELLKDPDLSPSQMARKVGLGSSKQLERLLRKIG